MQGTAPREDVMEFGYIALTVGFFLLTWGFVRLCDKV